MRYCQKCGGFVLQLESGGCGGQGSYHRCTSCGQVYRQETGGIVSTSGGETFRPLSEGMAALVLGLLPPPQEWMEELKVKYGVGSSKD